MIKLQHIVAILYSILRSTGNQCESAKKRYPSEEGRSGEMVSGGRFQVGDDLGYYALSLLRTVWKRFYLLVTFTCTIMSHGLEL